MIDFIEYAKRHPTVERIFRDYNNNREVNKTLVGVKLKIDVKDGVQDLQRRLGENMRDCIGELEEVIPKVFIEYVRDVLYKELVIK